LEGYAALVTGLLLAAWAWCGPKWKAAWSDRSLPQSSDRLKQPVRFSAAKSLLPNKLWQKPSSSVPHPNRSIS